MIIFLAVQRVYSPWEYAIGILVVLLILAIAILGKSDSLREALLSKIQFDSTSNSNVPRKQQKQLEEDWKDPLKQWARCVFAIQGGYGDFAYSTKEETLQNSAAKDFGLVTRQDLDRVLEQLNSDEAKDLVRAIYFCRVSVGLGILSQEESWKLIRPLCITLQENYDSFEEIGSEYREARMEWWDLTPTRAATDPDIRYWDDVVKWLRTEIWSKVPFKTDLSK